MDEEDTSQDERLRRWRLALGGASGGEGTGYGLTGADVSIDAALGALYDGGEGTGSQRGADSARRRHESRAGSATSGSTSRRRSCR